MLVRRSEPHQEDFKANSPGEATALVFLKKPVVMEQLKDPLVGMEK